MIAVAATAKNGSHDSGRSMVVVGEKNINDHAKEFGKIPDMTASLVPADISGD